MKKILFIHPALVTGGAETVLLTYLKELSKYKEEYQFDVVFMENRENFKFEEIPQNINTHFLLNEFESAFLVFLFNDLKRPHSEDWFRALKRKINHLLLDLINKHNYDLIVNFHGNISNFDDFLNEYDINKRIPVLYWVHSQWKLDQFSTHKDYYKYILNKYDGFITICNEMKNNCQLVLSDLNINKSILNVFNPVDLLGIKEKSYIDLESEEERELLSQEFILQVARLDERQKNHLQMIDIYYQLKQRGITEKLYIIGDGPSKTLLEEKISALGLEKDCLLLGQKMNPYPFMRKAKLFMHTARYEGLGMVLVESMICDTPAVAFACPVGPTDVLGHGRFGELVPLDNEALFVDKVYKLLIDDDSRNHFIKLLPEAIQRFDSDIIVKELIGFFEEQFKLKSNVL